MGERFQAGAIDAAARRSYEYEGARKSIAYIGWEREPQSVRDEWRASVMVAVAGYLDALPFPALARRNIDAEG